MSAMFDTPDAHCGTDALVGNFGWFLQGLLATLAFLCLISKAWFYLHIIFNAFFRSENYDFNALAFISNVIFTQFFYESEYTKCYVTKLWYL